MEERQINNELLEKHIEVSHRELADKAREELYKKLTDHIQDKSNLHIYDPSAGWGGRILGAMSVHDRQIHYIGTDPNTDNYIDELNQSRYEYLADFFNDKTNGGNPFFGHRNTYDVYQNGSEFV